MRTYRSLLGFILCAFAFTWIPELIRLSQWNSLVSKWASFTLSHFGPLEAAVLWTWIEGGRKSLWQFAGGLFRSGFSPIWYLVAALFPLACWIGAQAIVHWDMLLVFNFMAVRPAYYYSQLPWLYLTTLLDAPLGEEPGWRGFLLPRLQAKLCPFMATIILGLIWAGWHYPAWLLLSIDAPFWFFMVQVMALTFLLTWLYNRTRGNLLVCILFHASQNMGPQAWPLDSDQTGHVWQVVIWIAAGIVVITQRGWFRSPKKPEEVPRRASVLGPRL